MIMSARALKEGVEAEKDKTKFDADQNSLGVETIRRSKVKM